MKPAIVFALFLLALPVFGQSPYPIITGDPVSSDPLYRQQQSALQEAYRAEASGKPYPPLLIFLYSLPRDTDTLQIASRFGLSYDTLVSLNGWEGIGMRYQGDLISIPSQSGLFLSADSPPPLDRMILGTREMQGILPETQYIFRDNQLEEFVFFPGERYNAVERSFVLGLLFSMPLGEAVLTSDFGMREHPVYHTESFHTGIDLAAPTGTPVKAARAGMIFETGYDAIYGNYVIIDHRNGYHSKYGHLESVTVHDGEQIRTGGVLGTVGSTGVSTGSHLHFEIIREDSPIDPESMLFQE